MTRGKPGERAAVIRYAGRKEYAGVLYQILRFYLEAGRRDKSAAAEKERKADGRSFDA